MTHAPTPLAKFRPIKFENENQLAFSLFPPMPTARFLPRAALLFIALLTANSPTLLAADAATGAIAGRVLNQATARYVNNARVAVKGTTLQTFTDSSGVFLLEGVSPGAVTVVVSFTNLPPKEASVTITADLTADPLSFERADGQWNPPDSFVQTTATRLSKRTNISVELLRYSSLFEVFVERGRTVYSACTFLRGQPKFCFS